MVLLLLVRVRKVSSAVTHVRRVGSEWHGGLLPFLHFSWRHFLRPARQGFNLLWKMMVVETRQKLRLVVSYLPDEEELVLCSSLWFPMQACPWVSGLRIFFKDLLKSSSIFGLSAASWLLMSDCSVTLAWGMFACFLQSSFLPRMFLQHFMKLLCLHQNYNFSLKFPLWR